MKPDFFVDPELCELSYSHRLVFAGLWCHADKAGRIEYQPKKLKVQIMPYDKVDMIGILADLTLKPFIYLYEANGRAYIQIVNWLDHQNPHHTEKESIIPAYNGEITVKERLNNRCLKEEGLINTSHISSHLLNTSKSSSVITRDIDNKKFVAPTWEEVQAYGTESGTISIKTECLKFIDYYQSKGWKVGNAPMKDWRASWRNWHRKNKTDGKVPVAFEAKHHPKSCPDCFGNGYEIAQGSGLKYPCRRKEFPKDEPIQDQHIKIANLIGLTANNMEE